MNRHKRTITRCIVFLSFVSVVISCRNEEKPQQTDGTLSTEKAVQQQVTQKAYQWLCTHPTDIEVEGRLPVLEEMMTFYVLWKNTTDVSLKKTYLDEFHKRMDLLASIKDYQIEPIEYTAFLSVTLFAEKLHLDTAGLRKIIEEQMLPSPFLFSLNITSSIWSKIYLERLGYNCPFQLDDLVAQSYLQYEVQQQFISQAISSPVMSVNIDELTLATYFITHEIFSLTDFGEYPPPPIITSNKAFFSNFFEKTIHWTIAMGNVDLLGEIIMCIKMLDIKNVPSLHQGIQYIISRQQDGGSFGITNPALTNFYRHGVLISMLALSNFAQAPRL